MDKISAIQKLAFEAGYEDQMEKIAKKLGLLARGVKAVRGVARSYRQGMGDLAGLATAKGRRAGRAAKAFDKKIANPKSKEHAMAVYLGKHLPGKMNKTQRKAYEAQATKMLHGDHTGKATGGTSSALRRRRMMYAGGGTLAAAGVVGGGGYAAYRAARDE